jgi:hypothetical protein
MRAHHVTIYSATCILALLLLYAVYHRNMDALTALRAQNAALSLEVVRLQSRATTNAVALAPSPSSAAAVVVDDVAAATLLREQRCAATSGPRFYGSRADCLSRVAATGRAMDPEACVASGCCWASAPQSLPWCYLPLPEAPYDVAAIAARARFYAPDADAAGLLLMTAVDVLQRHEGDWLWQRTRPSFSSGADLVARYALALAAARRRVCQAPDVLLVAHLITADDAHRLEEWLLWHRVLGVDHVVVYNNGPLGDGSDAVLAPFVEAGWATVRRVPGRGVYQTGAVNEVVALLERKACHFSGTGDLFGAPDCGGGAAPPGAYAEPPGGRAVWLAPWDTDEFLSLMEDPAGKGGACAQDLLREHRAAAGLATPWVFYGHANHTVPPPGLVTAEFTRRAPAFEQMYKFVLQVHVAKGADFQRGHFVVARESAPPPEDELFRPLAGALHDFAPLTPATARVRLNHYVTGSTQQLLKKWIEGVISAPSDPWTGTPSMRPAVQIAQWLRLGAEAWVEEDYAARDAGVASLVAAILREDNPAPSVRMAAAAAPRVSPRRVIQVDNRPLQLGIDTAGYHTLSAVINFLYADLHGYNFSYIMPSFNTTAVPAARARLLARHHGGAAGAANGSAAPGCPGGARAPPAPPDSALLAAAANVPPGKDTVTAWHPALGHLRAASWAKLPALWAALRDLEAEGPGAEALFLDSDAFVARQHVDFSEEMRSTVRGRLLWGNDAATTALVFYTNAPYNQNVPCAGAFLLRGGRDARGALRAWWDTSAHPAAHAYEQDALWSLMHRADGSACPHPHFSRAAAAVLDVKEFREDGVPYAESQWLHHSTEWWGGGRRAVMRARLSELGVGADEFDALVRRVEATHKVSVDTVAAAELMHAETCSAERAPEPCYAYLT